MNLLNDNRLDKIALNDKNIGNEVLRTRLAENTSLTPSNFGINSSASYIVSNIAVTENRRS